MDGEPPRWWMRLKLGILWYTPLEPRKKIKRLIQLGDEFTEKGAQSIAQKCYARSLDLAENARVVHLRKKLESRFQ